MKKPLLVINYKAYEQGTGDKGLRISKAAESVSESIILCPQAFDLRMIAKAVNNQVFAQSIDPVNPGAHTGSNTMLSAIKAGASGLLINHSECRVKFEVIKELVSKAREHGLTSIVCAQNLAWVKQAAELMPDYIAYEPPALIGGDVSVTSAKPEVIIKCVKACNGIPLLVGAGVKSSEDAAQAVKLGARGVLVASGVIKAAMPVDVINSLFEGLCK